MIKLFISYAHKDKEVIANIVNELNSVYEVWIDVDDICIGSKWNNEIIKAIKCCNYFIIFVSNNSLNSKYCNEELDLAIKLNKKVIPILIEELVLPKHLNELQCIYLDDIYKLFSRLTKTKLDITILLLILNIILTTILLIFNI